MSEHEEYTPSMYEIKTFSVWRPDTFDRAIAAHDRALREQIARAVEERREHFISETTLTLGGLPAWTDAYLNGLDDAIDVARWEDQTDE